MSARSINQLDRALIREGLPCIDAAIRRPRRGLCTFNGFDWVQRFKEDAVIGMVCRFEGWMERRRITMKRPAGAEEVDDQASPVR